MILSGPHVVLERSAPLNAATFPPSPETEEDHDGGVVIHHRGLTACRRLSYIQTSLMAPVAEPLMVGIFQDVQDVLCSLILEFWSPELSLSEALHRLQSSTLLSGPGLSPRASLPLLTQTLTMLLLQLRQRGVLNIMWKTNEAKC